MFQPVLEFLDKFGNVVGRLLLTIVYYVAVGPIAIFYSLFSDVLMTKQAPRSTYRPWESFNDNLQDAARQD